VSGWPAAVPAAPIAVLSFSGSGKPWNRVLPRWFDYIGSRPSRARYDKGARPHVVRAPHDGFEGPRSSPRGGFPPASTSSRGKPQQIQAGLMYWVQERHR